MLLTPPALVIFESDGVLVNSDRVTFGCRAGALSEAGIEIGAAEARRRYAGLSPAGFAEAAESESGRPLPEGWRERLEASTNARLRGEVKAVPGIQAALLAIRAAGIKVAVASSGSPAKMTLALGMTALIPYFESRLFSASLVAHGKPEPDLLSYVGAVQGVPPQRVAVVDNSVRGIAAAVAAGMHALGFAGDPETDREGLAKAGATVFTALAKLPELLRIAGPSPRK